MFFGKTILLVMDQGVGVYTGAGKNMRFVEMLRWRSDGFDQKIMDCLMNKCSGRPVVVLNDMVEQHYRKENIIKVRAGSLDRANIIKRKLVAAFPSYPLRASLMQKEKIKKVGGKPAADIYLFAAIPQSEQLEKTMQMLKSTIVSVNAYCMLPTESTDMVAKLASKIASTSKEKATPKWNIFIGQHQNGSLRQVVTKNGELALTRMTPITEKEGNQDRWGKEINQELRATIGYLSRFGYSPGDGLGVIAICDENDQDAITLGLDKSIEFSCLSNNNAAKMLGLPISIQKEPHYADILHVAWVANKVKYTLPMSSPRMEAFAKPRKMAFWGAVIMFLSALLLAIGVAKDLKESSALAGKIDRTKQQQLIADQNHAAQLEKNKSIGFNATLVQGSVLIYEELEATNLPILEIANAFGSALGSELRLNKLGIQRYKDNMVSRVANFSSINNEQPFIPLYETEIELIYPSTANIDAGNIEIEDLKDRIANLLPDYKVRVEKLLKDYEYTEGIVVKTGETENAQQAVQDFTARISIKGPSRKEADSNASDGRR